MASGVSRNFLVREGGKFMNFRQGGSISDKMPKFPWGEALALSCPPVATPMCVALIAKSKTFAEHS